MVRANYNDLKNNIHETTEYLEKFLRNLLLGEKNGLHNREMHISGKFSNAGKQDIQEQKQDIGNDNAIPNRTLGLSLRTKQNIEKLYRVIGYNNVFVRSEIMNVLGITPSPASELIKKMLVSGIIEPVKGYGKGKYRFLK